MWAHAAILAPIELERGRVRRSASGFRRRNEEETS